MWPWRKKDNIVMEPDTRTDADIVQARYPSTECRCKHIAVNICKTNRYNLKHATICMDDRNYRYCRGRCSHFEDYEEWMSHPGGDLRTLIER